MAVIIWDGISIPTDGKNGNIKFFHGLEYRNKNQTGTAFYNAVFYWTSGAKSISFGSDLASFETSIYPQDNYNRSHGFCVRSVKE